MAATGELEGQIRELLAHATIIVETPVEETQRVAFAQANAKTLTALADALYLLAAQFDDIASK